MTLSVKINDNDYVIFLSQHNEKIFRLARTSKSLELFNIAESKSSILNAWSEGKSILTLQYLNGYGCKEGGIV